MAKVVKIYGASDDLLEIEGALREEFGIDDNDKPHYLMFSTGTVISVNYGIEGTWEINERKLADGDTLSIIRNEGDDSDRRDDDTPKYSDVATLTLPDGDHTVALVRRFKSF